MNTYLENKTVFITGGNSGIGKEIALAYGREEGVRIAVSYFNGNDRADKVVQSLRTNGRDAFAVYLDLQNTDTIRDAIARIINKWGSIDVLINNAVKWPPPSHGKRFEEIPIEYWEEVFHANLFGVVSLLNSVIPYMRKNRWGRIVNISSDLANDSMQGSGPYSAVKAALHGVTQSLVAELSPENILSNVVLPSLTLTENARSRFSEPLLKNLSGVFPTGRMTRPEDIASLVVYLGSGANRHVNGEVIKVTGNVSQQLLSHTFFFRKEEN